MKKCEFREAVDEWYLVGPASEACHSHIKIFDKHGKLKSIVLPGHRRQLIKKTSKTVQMPINT